MCRYRAKWEHVSRQDLETVHTHTKRSLILHSAHSTHLESSKSNTNTPFSPHPHRTEMAFQSFTMKCTSEQQIIRRSEFTCERLTQRLLLYSRAVSWHAYTEIDVRDSVVHWRGCYAIPRMRLLLISVRSIDKPKPKNTKLRTNDRTDAMATHIRSKARTAISWADARETEVGWER